MIVDRTKIINKTLLNSSLFTFLSSGSYDVIMSQEWREDKPPYPLIPDKESKIPIGDRYTLFLNELFTNYFFLDLDFLGLYETIHLNFKTTKDYSFSLTRYGNKYKYVDKDILLIGDAQLWGKGNVRNLEEYFDRFPRIQTLEFDFVIQKVKSYKLIIYMTVSDPDYKRYKVIYSGYPIIDEFKEIEFNSGESHIIENMGFSSISTEYEFITWNTMPDRKGIDIDPGTNITVDTNVVLYGVWNKKGS